MPPRRRLRPEQRRRELVDVAARLFADRGYDDVSLADVAVAAHASRALAYRHFASKRDLFATVYAEAAARLLELSAPAPGQDLDSLLQVGLDAHLDYFVANRRTVLDANRTLGGDPVIAAIIADELAALVQALLTVMDVPEVDRPGVATVLSSWLVFVRTYSVEWLAAGGDRIGNDRQQVRAVCTGALLGALGGLEDLPTTSGSVGP